MVGKKKITFTRADVNVDDLFPEPAPPVAEPRPKKKRRRRVKTVEEPESSAPPKRQVPKSWAYPEMTKGLYNFLKKHRPATFGDALSMIHDWRANEEDELLEQTFGDQGDSEFMTDLLWHISYYDGPKAPIKYGDS